LTLPPERIGPYNIARELGRGGMGVVYLATDTRLDRQVAIKALPASWRPTRLGSSVSSGRPRPSRSSTTPTSPASTALKSRTVLATWSLSTSKARRSQRRAIPHAAKSLSVAPRGSICPDPESAIRHLFNSDTSFPRPYEGGQEIVRPLIGTQGVRAPAKTDDLAKLVEDATDTKRHSDPGSS
jgi:hypothetical protein